jgi:hypothetical protein
VLLQITCGGSVWSISRRFSDFCDLNDQIKEKLRRARVTAELPQKKWFGRFDDSFLTKRMRTLQQYVDTLLASAKVNQNKTLLTFLEVHRNVVENAPAPMAEPAYAAEPPEAPAEYGHEQPDEHELEADRQNAIVNYTAQAFIDISKPEQVDIPQARQRQHELLDHCAGFNSCTPGALPIAELALHSGVASDGVAEALAAPALVPDTRAALDKLAMQLSEAVDAASVFPESESLVGVLAVMRLYEDE